MFKRKKLGEMLIEAGLLTENELQKTLRKQKQSKLKLGQFLVSDGIILESELVFVISQQLKIDIYNAEKYPVNLELSKLFSADAAKKMSAVPVQVDGNVLMVAMTDPLDITIFDKIESITNLEVEAVICTEKEANQLISLLYGSFSDIDDVLDTVENLQINSDKADDEESKKKEKVDLALLKDISEDAPVIRLVNSIFIQAVKDGASDIHISPEKDYVQLRFRGDGRLYDVPAPPKSLFLSVISRIKILANLDIAVSRVPQDGRFTIKVGQKEVNVRVSTLPTIYGENLVLRLLDTSTGIYSLNNLGISPSDIKKIESIINKPYGMILSTGPTGSGKSTTLYSILKQLNKPDINIITLEDPVEYRMDKIRQVQLNQKAGMTFGSGLRAILRQDPDVIMVGEIRDSETASISVQAALTGHRVLSTVHTNDAAGAITRFIDMGVEPFLVSSVILISIAQRLVRRVCSNCAEPYTPSESKMKYWELEKFDKSNFLKGRGCFQCNETGYKGRVGVYEVLLVDEDVQTMILDQRSGNEISKAGIKSGSLKTLKDDAAEKIAAGLTTCEEVLTTVMNY